MDHFFPGLDQMNQTTVVEGALEDKSKRLRCYPAAACVLKSILLTSQMSTFCLDILNVSSEQSQCPIFSQTVPLCSSPLLEAAVCGNTALNFFTGQTLSRQWTSVELQKYITCRWITFKKQCVWNAA